jgi:hypothetical protein
MGKLYWLAAIGVLGLGLSFAYYFGHQAMNQKIVPWTQFADSREASEKLRLSLERPLSEKRVVFLGPHPLRAWHLDLCLDLVAALKKRENVILVVDRILAQREKRVAQLPAAYQLDLFQDQELFRRILRELKTDQRLLYLGPSVYVSHVISGSAISQFQDELKSKSYSVLTTTPFPQSKEEESAFEFPCRASEGSSTQIDFGCLVLSESRQLYSRPRAVGNQYGFLNQIRNEEYLLFLGP